ncbi:MAG: hypothetical protein KGN84_13075, partial [Acidobacteriota bacterium]|nr:hypothetical protein [Acidobacteriota bacterium]
MLPVVIGTIVLLLQPQAHPATPPKFEVASIRPCRETEKGAGGRGRKKGGLRSDPGNLHIGCETIERLIQFAWLGYPEGKPWTTPGLSGLPEPPIPFTRMFQPIEGAPS